MAAVLRVLPFSEASIRFSTALVGAVGVGLIFILARRVFASSAVAWIVAITFALSPTYYIHSRLALSVVYPVPFTILWLIALHEYLTTRRPRMALVVGLVLGIGVYSYLAAALLMPVYLLATCVVLAFQRDWPAARRVVAAFVLLMLPLLAWQAIEPQRYSNILTAYRLYDENPTTSGGLLQQMVSGAGLTDRVNVFWDAFNPARLFFTGESSLQISTREVGSLLAPAAVLIVTGLVTLLRSAQGPIERLLVVGLITAPLPGVIMADVEIRRWLVVLPFAAMIAGIGADRLRRAGALGRATTAVLVALMALQFAAFTRDYFGAYRERSSIWFGGNIRAALEMVLADARARTPSMVYIASDIPWVEAYWRFYSTVHGQSLLERTRYVRLQSGEIPAAVPDAVIVTPILDLALETSLRAAGWASFRAIPDLDGHPSLTVGSPSAAAP